MYVLCFLGLCSRHHHHHRHNASNKCNLLVWYNAQCSTHELIQHPDSLLYGIGGLVPLTAGVAGSDDGLVEGTVGRTTLPSSKMAGPLGISPTIALAASSSAGSSSYFQSSSPPYGLGRSRGSMRVRRAEPGSLPRTCTLRRVPSSNQGCAGERAGQG